MLASGVPVPPVDWPSPKVSVQVAREPGNASWLAEPSKVTMSGVGPLVLSATSAAVGGVFVANVRSAPQWLPHTFVAHSM